MINGFTSRNLRDKNFKQMIKENFLPNYAQEKYTRERKQPNS